MSALIPFLWFNDQAEEAARYYVGIFPDAKMGEIQRFPAESRGPEGSVMTASFTLGDQQLVALNGNPRFAFSPAMSLLYSCANADDAARLTERCPPAARSSPVAGCATSTACRGRCTRSPEVATRQSVGFAMDDGFDFVEVENSAAFEFVRDALDQRPVAFDERERVAARGDELFVAQAERCHGLPVVGGAFAREYPIDAQTAVAGFRARTRQQDHRGCFVRHGDDARILQIGPVQRAVDLFVQVGDRRHVVEDQASTDRGHRVRGFVNRGASGDLQLDWNGGRYRA